MILIDAGPLVALVNRSDAWHEQCLATSKALHEPVFTLWPVVTEAVFLVRKSVVAQTEIFISSKEVK